MNNRRSPRRERLFLQQRKRYPEQTFPKGWIRTERELSFGFHVLLAAAVFESRTEHARIGVRPLLPGSFKRRLHHVNPVCEKASSLGGRHGRSRCPRLPLAPKGEAGGLLFAIAVDVGPVVGDQTPRMAAADVFALRCPIALNRLLLFAASAAIPGNGNTLAIRNSANGTFASRMEKLDDDGLRDITGFWFHGVLSIG